MLQDKLLKFVQIYAIKFFILIGFIGVTYIVTAIAEGKFHKEWSTTGATVFYIVSTFLLLHIITYKIDRIE